MSFLLKGVKRLFWGNGGAPDCPNPPPPPEPVKPQEPSCFVKGIALSIAQENMRGWGETSGCPSYGDEGWLDITHYKHQVRVIGYGCKDNPLEGCKYISLIAMYKPESISVYLTKQEESLIARAIEAKPLHQFYDFLQKENRDAETETYFTQLGCPDKP